MAAHNDLGKLGEMLAKEYVIKSGLQVLHVNWKFPPFEIDLIACSAGKLHFIEVKTRSTTQFGYPEEHIDIKKFRNLQKAATQFLRLYPNWKIVQFDVLSIFIDRNRQAEFFYIEDVHY